MIAYKKITIFTYNPEAKYQCIEVEASQLTTTNEIKIFQISDSCFFLEPNLVLLADELALFATQPVTVFV